MVSAPFPPLSSRRVRPTASTTHCETLRILRSKNGHNKFNLRIHHEKRALTHADNFCGLDLPELPTISKIICYTFLWINELYRGLCRSLREQNSIPSTTPDSANRNSHLPPTGKPEVRVGCPAEEAPPGPA